MKRIDGHVVRAEQPLAVELASTIHVTDGQVIDALSTATQLRQWLAINDERLGRPGRFAVGHLLPELRLLRDGLRRLFTAAVEHQRPVAADIDTINAATRAAPDHVEVRWAGGRPRAERVATGAPGRTVLARLSADGIEVLIGTYGQLAACEGPSCVLFFVPTHPRQAWCSPGCANRGRVARHYRRTRSSA